MVAFVNLLLLLDLQIQFFVALLCFIDLSSEGFRYCFHFPFLFGCLFSGVANLRLQPLNFLILPRHVFGH